MFFLNRITKKNIEKEYQKGLPANYLREDIFLVSFPRSGNTWFRFLIANAIKTHYSIQREVNFFSIQDIIPEVRASEDRFLQNIRYEGIFGTTIPRIIKSHSYYNPYYLRVFLLVRDPRDVCVSYYHYLRDRQAISQNHQFSDFCKHKQYGIEAWVKHTESWFLSLRQGQIIQLFRYEDLLKDPEREMSKLMSLLGLEARETALKEAVQLSSKEKMKASENTHRSTYLMKSKSKPFVRQGQVTDGKKLSTTDRKFIEDASRDIAQKLGYQY
ncbi:MAG: sulfotransferase domain-containing protein [Cyanophyceae cyanobacterium]